jgi:DNA-directed RNA polymerase specialized sigma24 family protein
VTVPTATPASIDAALLQRLRRQARRLGARPDDAEDLLQATLLAALEGGRSDLPWLAGVMVRQHALAARSAVRRRRREDRAVDWNAADAGPAIPVPGAVLRALPTAARRVAVLALHGLDGAEIRCLLGLSAPAFRQRLSTIRRCLRRLPPGLQAEACALASAGERPRSNPHLPAGLLRRSLVRALARGPGRGSKPALGTHDDDGHLLLFRCDHVSVPGGN